MEFFFFEAEIWYAWLGLRKNWVLIMQDKNSNFFLYCALKIGMAQIGY